ncbi:MAG: hypothetical protein A2W47_07125 [Gammaproteobacteria bacterium RIFCSPHIGHO2_12_38_15]|nr:MAG: hypothetical protein A2W47_07125 [Gammaproteobacteria bacterium RIFCSPHIGHO2_12_38_15]
MSILNRIYLHIWPTKLLKQLTTDMQRRAFFIREYQQMVHRMWRGEFVSAKLRELRESRRREYDKVNEDMLAVKNAYGKEESNLGTDVKEKLQKGIESKEKDIAAIKEQIDGLDKELANLSELMQGYQEGFKLLEEIIKQ